MESQLLLEIVTPDKVVVNQPVDYIGVPGVEGEFGVLPNHIPLLSALSIGHLYFRVGGKTEHVFISGGFAEVTDNRISVLAESAERDEDIDIARAQAAKARAEKRLTAADDSVDTMRAQAALQRALLRLNVAGMKSTY